MIEDLTDALQSGKPVLPPNPTPQQQTQYNTDLNAFNAGVAFVLKQFPNGAPGNLQSRTVGNNIPMGKADYIINSSNTLSTFFNYMRSHGERAIQTPIVLGNVGRNGSDDVCIDSYNARLTSTFARARSMSYVSSGAAISNTRSATRRRRRLTRTAAATSRSAARPFCSATRFPTSAGCSS